jgi:outer membrane protein OmpA-like peptidoglycan-associated protein
MALPLAAQAQIVPYPGIYVGIEGGAVFPFSGTSSGGTSLTPGVGYTVGGKIGYDFVGPRVEIEGTYGWVPTNVFVPGTALTNKISALNALINVYYDFMPASVITPYIGAGAGISLQDGNGSFSNTLFAYQAILGVAWNASDALRLTLEARYAGATQGNVTFNGVNSTFPNNAIVAMAGISYKFGQPSMAAPPPPAPVTQAPSYMVFFDWDRSNLSDQALATIGQAANAYKTKGNARITATGHTDTSGPESYNMALSLRRANTVKDALVRNGVPATAIAVIGRGEQGLLVQTADGVREPQNRRVEIVIQ